MMALTAILAIFLPLLGSLSVIFCKVKKVSTFSKSYLLPLFYLGGAFLCSSFLLYWIMQKQAPTETDFFLFSWISVLTLKVKWAIRLDILSCVMLWILDLVSLIVHIYIMERMENISSRNTLLIYLGFFTFSMGIFLVSNNFLQLFFGWELVGIFSYLIIGFYSESAPANAAAFKGFIMNSVGDIALLAAIIIIYNNTQSFSFDVLEKESIANFPSDTVGLLGGLLFVAAMTKSAQIGFHSWLSSAMEASTTVSALVHSSTIVTTGVFLLLRLSSLLEVCPTLKLAIIITGSLTTILCAASALTQNSIKKILGYSISSQVGFIMIDIGFSYYNFVLFHLIAHSLIYPLIFLSTGVLLESSEEGGRNLKKPFIYPIILIGLIGLCVIPFFSGHCLSAPFLKIMSGDFALKTVIFFSLSCAGSFLTALYTGRIILLTFHGNKAVAIGAEEHSKEPSPWINLSMMGLILLSLVLGFLVSTHLEFSIYALVVMGVVIGLGFTVIGSLYFLFQDVRNSLTRKLNPLHRTVEGGWYFNELYAFILVRPFNFLAHFFAYKAEYGFFDKIESGSILFFLKKTNSAVLFFQPSRVSFYMISLILGVIAAMAFLVFR